MASPFQWRNDSGELDVFEAARYFSGVHESLIHIDVPRLELSFTRNGARGSFDMRIPSQIQGLEANVSESKKWKQPRSTGARLARFLSALFSQKSLKKKKKQKSRAFNDPEEENKCHFPVTGAAKSGADLKPIYPSASTVFTLPHLYADSPTKSFKEFQGDKFPVLGEIFKKNELFCYDEKRNEESAWNAENFYPRNGLPEKPHKSGVLELSWQPKKSLSTRGDPECPSEETEFRKFSDADDDRSADTDSSSDLFDLPNHGSDFSPNVGLPVYETTPLRHLQEVF